MIYGQLEIEIMNVIWNKLDINEDIDISIADVVEDLSENNIDRAYTTVKTVMDRLVSKDILVRYRNGKKFFYKTTVDRYEASKQAVETLAKHFFEGSTVKMLRFVEKECEALLV